MDPSEPGDQDGAALVKSIQAGNAEAETLLVKKYGPSIIGFLRRNRGVEVKDLAQQTLLIGIEQIRNHKIKDPQKVGSFLLGIARNQVRSAFKKNVEWVPHEDNQNPPFHLAVGPYESLTRKELAAYVRDVLARLPVERDREILFKFFIQEQDKNTICRELDLTPDHFNRVIYRAKERLRKIIEEDDTFTGS